MCHSKFVPSNPYYCETKIGSEIFSHSTFLYNIKLNTFYNKIRKWLKLPYHSLANEIKKGVKGALLHIKDFEDNALKLTIQQGFDVAVCGHIHQPKLENDYMNSGDFCENSTCLVEDFEKHTYIDSII